MANKTYNNQVFINCPFDLEYVEMYRASIFTIIDSGFVPRCSREVNNGNSTRIDNIVKLIRECKYGLHDLSRIQLNHNNYPRFNMPFEYGIFYGSQKFGTGDHEKKCSLVLEVEQYRYQHFISDISGIDVSAHNNDHLELIRKVREWLHTSSRRKTVPQSNQIIQNFNNFQNHMRSLCVAENESYDDMTFLDLTKNMTDWLRFNDTENA